MGNAFMDRIFDIRGNKGRTLVIKIRRASAFECDAGDILHLDTQCLQS